MAKAMSLLMCSCKVTIAGIALYWDDYVAEFLVDH